MRPAVRSFEISDDWGKTNVKKTILRTVILGLLAVTLAGAAWADSVELRNGQIVQGKFLGASQFNVRMLVSGKEEVIPVRDILNISFNDAGVGSATPAPPINNFASSGDSEAAAAAQAAPAQQTVTLPAGTALMIRMIDSIDSSKNKVGDIFHASLENPIVSGNTVIAPKGADVYGKLAQVKSAGHISGSSDLTLELTGVRVGGQVVPLSTTDYNVAGKSRGKQSAERIGGGAALGAIIGAVAGGGKGAAIGAGVGGGAGTAVQVITHGQQVRIPSETLLEFRLQQPATVNVPSASY